MVTHSAAGAMGPWFNSPVGRPSIFEIYLLAPLHALAGKQCLAMRCTVATNCDRIMQCS